MNNSDKILMNYNILLIGNKNSGKSTFLNKYKTGDYKSVNVTNINVNTECGLVNFNIVETNTLDIITKNYDGIIIMCDNIQQLLAYKQHINNSITADKPIIPVISKNDIIGNDTVSNAISISSKYNVNIDYIFDLMTFAITHKISIPRLSQVPEAIIL